VVRRAQRFATLVLILLHNAHGAKFAKAPRLSDTSRLSIRMPAHFTDIFRNRAQTAMAAHSEAQIFLTQNVVEDT
jgi:hypothetical protein